MNYTVEVYDTYHIEIVRNEISYVEFYGDYPIEFVILRSTLNNEILFDTRTIKTTEIQNDSLSKPGICPPD
jgi:hypothetical protein